MNAPVIKALCRRIQERYGSNRAAALVADVPPSVWSDYCSDAKPTCTIPFGRLLMVANEAERGAFAELLTGPAAEPPPGDLVSEASEVTEAAASMQRTARLVAADGKVTRREARQMVEAACAVKAEADDVIRLVGRAA